jgi:hypothetical protein
MIIRNFNYYWYKLLIIKNNIKYKAFYLFVWIMFIFIDILDSILGLFD